MTDVIVFACSMLCVSHELSSTCRLVQAALLASEDLPRMAQHVQVPKWRQRLRGKQAWQFEWDLEKEWHNMETSDNKKATKQKQPKRILALRRYPRRGKHRSGKSNWAKKTKVYARRAKNPEAMHDDRSAAQVVQPQPMKRFTQKKPEFNNLEGTHAKASVLTAAILEPSPKLVKVTPKHTNPQHVAKPAGNGHHNQLAIGISAVPRHYETFGTPVRLTPAVLEAHNDNQRMNSKDAKARSYFQPSVACSEFAAVNAHLEKEVANMQQKYRDKTTKLGQMHKRRKRQRGNVADIYGLNGVIASQSRS